MKVWRIVVAAALAALAAPVAAETGNVRINDPASGQTAPVCNSQSDPALARNEDRMVAVWMDVGRCEAALLAPRPRVPDASLAGYARSTDGGQTWTDGGTLPAPAGGLLVGAPAIAAGAGAGRFHAASAAVDGEGSSFLAVLRSTDGGQTFSSPLDVSGERPSPQALQSGPAVAADRDGRVHVAWREHAQGLDGSSRTSVLFATSANHGVTFTAPMLISGYGQRPGDPRIVVGPNGEVYVAWYAGGSLWITRSTDGGRTFRSPTLVGTVPEIGHREACVLGGWKQVLNGNLAAGQDPSLAVDLGATSRRGWLFIAAAAATRPGDEADVVLARSTDGGATWSELRRVNDDDGLVDQFNPEVAVRDDGTVAVTWYDRRLSGGVKTPNWRLNVFAATSADGGATFSRNVRLSDAAHDPARAFPIPTSDDVCPPPSRGTLVETGGGFLAAWGDNRTGTQALPDLDVYAARL